MVERHFNYVDSNKQIAADATDFPYGLHHDYIEDLTTFTTSSATFVTTLTLSPIGLPAGNYMLNWATLWSASSLGSTIEIRITLDTVQEWLVDIKGDVAVGTKADAAAFKLLALDGSHTIALQMRKAVGGGTCSLHDRMLKLERWD